MRKYILISIILVCTYGCSNENSEDRIKNLENEKNNLSLKLQKLSTDLGASSDVVKDVTALIKDIQETENKIEERKHILRSSEDVESAVGMKEDILNSIQGLYDDLKRHRGKAVELQKMLDSFVSTNTQQNEEISSVKNLIQEKTIKIERLVSQVDSLKKHVTHLEKKQEELTNKISNLKSELDVKEIEASKKELEIKNLHQEINTIFYIIGNSKELRRKKIIIKKGIPLLRSLNLYSKNFVLGSDFTLAEFKREKSTLTKFRIDGKIKKILPYRNKNHYDISYENGLSFLNIKDSKSFWHQKYLVVVTN
ncbi:MAG: coiled-coil domain-containing protein [Planctomycetota bacterium]|jgi:chromosome segregation ATPase